MSAAAISRQHAGSLCGSDGGGDVCQKRKLDLLALIPNNQFSAEGTTTNLKFLCLGVATWVPRLLHAKPWPRKSTCITSAARNLLSQSDHNTFFVYHHQQDRSPSQSDASHVGFRLVLPLPQASPEICSSRRPMQKSGRAFDVLLWYPQGKLRPQTLEPGTKQLEPVLWAQGNACLMCLQHITEGLNLFLKTPTYVSREEMQSMLAPVPGHSTPGCVEVLQHNYREAKGDPLPSRPPQRIWGLVWMAELCSLWIPLFYRAVPSIGFSNVSWCSRGLSSSYPKGFLRTSFFWVIFKFSKFVHKQFIKLWFCVCFAFRLILISPWDVYFILNLYWTENKFNL